VRTGSTVTIQSSFQDFLAEQLSLQTTQNTGTPDGSQSCTAAATAAGASTAGETVHILRQGETIWELARERYRVDPAEILSHNHITNPAKLRVGQEIRIPGKEKAGSACTPEEVVAGWYGEYHQGRLMANGERFDMYGATIAHRDMPIGTKVELENPETGEKAEAVVTDRGPYHRGRDVDLSFGLAERLSLTKQGTGNLKMRVL